MRAPEAESKEKLHKEKARQAIALAMQSQWESAVEANTSIIQDFPDDVEAYNRLGKALMELGRNREAQEAFQKALQLSPHNSIARKNLDRLRQLGERVTRAPVKVAVAPQMFIEESGKSGLTALVDLAPPKVLLKLSPGDPLVLTPDGSTLTVSYPRGGYVGRVEPKLASRLARLIKGGNRYHATVTSAAHNELTIMVREVYQHPSQLGVISFPTRGGPEYNVYLPSTVLGYELGEEETEESEQAAVKDWSDDDTEPGDDDAYSPVLHRIISAGEEATTEEEESF